MNTARMDEQRRTRFLIVCNLLRLSKGFRWIELRHHTLRVWLRESRLNYRRVWQLTKRSLYSDRTGRTACDSTANNQRRTRLNSARKVFASQLWPVVGTIRS